MKQFNEALNDSARPSFPSPSKKSAYLSHNVFNGGNVDENKPALTKRNAAMPHRMSWHDISKNTRLLINGKEDAADFKRWTGRFDAAGNDRIQKIEGKITGLKSLSQDPQQAEDLLKNAEASHTAFQQARDELANNPKDPTAAKTFLKFANGFHANVPDLGPHYGVNNPVGKNAHLNTEESRGRPTERALSPMSERVAEMSPHRISGIATASNGGIITVRGNTIPYASLTQATQNALAKHENKVINGYDPNFTWTK